MRWAAVAALVVAGCDGATYLPRDALLDPETCRTCHAAYVRDWSGSMHAYAAEDPVFLAMNARGQRETNGALGDFCVGCHAPMAVREGATRDGLNLADVPRKLKGVTCYFCHTVERVDGAHNNALTLASDGVLRASFSDPVPSRAHAAGYSPLLDRERLESSSLCGACHDLVTPAGAALERTFAEWQASVFNLAPGGRTCGQCHMSQAPAPMPIAEADGVFARRAHSHQFPGVDLALGPFPEADAQRRQVQQLLDTTLQSAVCVAQVGGGFKVRVILDNVAAGHGWPSGAAQDRRAWVELAAYSGDQLLYRSGAVPDGTAVTAVTGDPDLWLLRDCMSDAAGRSVGMFWQAATTEGNELPGQATFDRLDPRFYQTHILRPFPVDGAPVPGAPDRVTVRVRLQPIGLDVLADLVASGDLDASVAAAMPTFDVASTPPLTWSPAAAAAAADTYVEGGVVFSCVSDTSLSGQGGTFPATKNRTCAP